MKVLSLFDGISCAQQALKELGIYDLTYFASEIDKYAIELTKKNFPDTINIGSVTNICYGQYEGNGVYLMDEVDCVNQRHVIKDHGTGIDLLIGGSPCQDLSIAKRNREGLSGKRSGLFWEYVRLLNQAKPKFFVLENVNSMPKEARDTITKTLFGIEPIMINASLVSAQNRKRLFWVGKRVGSTYKKVNINLPEDKGILLRDILEPQVDSIFEVKPKSNTVRSSGRGSGINDKHNWDTIRIGHLGKGGQGDRIYSVDGKSVNLSANGGGRGAKTGLYLVAPNGKQIILGDAPLQVLVEGRTELGKESRRQIRQTTGKDSTFRSKEHKAYFGREGVKANCITTNLGAEGMVAIIKEATKKGYAIAQEGQSINFSFPESQTRRGRVGDKAKNIMTSQNIGVFTKGIIRKLTPLECERLQSLPDNYTASVSNSQRYKVLGNAFNCEVIKHILRHII